MEDLATRGKWETREWSARVGIDGYALKNLKNLPTLQVPSYMSVSIRVIFYHKTWFLIGFGIAEP